MVISSGLKKTLLISLALFVSSVSADSTLSATQDIYRKGGFYALYAENRQRGIANLITEDFLLQAYSMLRGRTLVVFERERLLPALERTVAALSALLNSSEPHRYSSRSKTYVSVLEALLSGSDAGLNDAQAQAELALIKRAQWLRKSPLWGYAIDYSVLEPRGQYRDDPDLLRYFVATRYANSVLMPVVPSAATGVSAADAETFAAQAKELAGLLAMPSVAEHYAALSSGLDWQFGRADDLTADDIRAVQSVEGESLATAVADYAIAHDKVPTIISAGVELDSLEPGVSAQQVLTGWRLLPLRWSADAQAIQQLVFDQSEQLRWPCAECAAPPLSSALRNGWYKGYASYIELMALHGSAQAGEYLSELGLNDYSDYRQRQALAQSAYTQSAGLAALQLPILRAALRADGSEHALQTGAGFWLWQRYLGLLYQKQPSTPFSKSALLLAERRGGSTLAKNTVLYEKLAKLASVHAEREKSQVWVDFAALVARCTSISADLDKGELLSLEQEDFLNNLDTRLQSITGRDDAPIVVDMHNNFQDQKVWQLALAMPKQVFEVSARGARFNLQEFALPMAQRLNKQTWRQKLQGISEQ